MWTCKTAGIIGVATLMASVAGGPVTTVSLAVSTGSVVVLALCGALTYRSARSSGRARPDRGKVIGWVIIGSLWVAMLVAVSLLLRVTVGVGTVLAYGAQFLWATFAVINLLTFSLRWAPTRM